MSPIIRRSGALRPICISPISRCIDRTLWIPENAGHYLFGWFDSFPAFFGACSSDTVNYFDSSQKQKQALFRIVLKQCQILLRRGWACCPECANAAPIGADSFFIPIISAGYDSTVSVSLCTLNRQSAKTGSWTFLMLFFVLTVFKALGRCSSSSLNQFLTPAIKREESSYTEDKRSLIFPFFVKSTDMPASARNIIKATSPIRLKYRQEPCTGIYCTIVFCGDSVLNRWLG